MTATKLTAIALTILLGAGACSDAGVAPENDPVFERDEQALAPNQNDSLGGLPTRDETEMDLPTASTIPIPGEATGVNGFDDSDSSGGSSSSPPPCTALRIQGPTFVSGKATLTAAGRDAIDAVIRDQLTDDRLECEAPVGTFCQQVDRIDVHGHTDPHPVAGGNQSLSRGRAETVRLYLEANGLTVGIAVGHAAASPTGDGDDSDRRVELVLHCGDA